MSTPMNVDRGKSICRCGHTGDGPGSAHTATVQDGHGACRKRGCACAKFTWAAWRDTPVPSDPKPDARTDPEGHREWVAAEASRRVRELRAKRTP